MNRRSFIRAGLAAFALSTGLARASVDLVDDEPLYLAPLRWVGMDELRALYDYQRCYIDALTGAGALRIAVRKERIEPGFVARRDLYRLP